MTTPQTSTRILLPLTLLLASTALAGCLDQIPGEAQLPGQDTDPAATVDSFHLDTNDAPAWIVLHLEHTPAQGIPLDNVTIEHRATTTDATTVTQAQHLCATPLITQDECEHDASDPWRQDVRIFTPCPDDADTVHVYVDGDRIAEGQAEACTTSDEEADEDETEETGPEQAAATAKGADLDGDGNVEWMQVTLTSGENAPYAVEDTEFSVTGSSGERPDTVCNTAETSDGVCEDPFRAGDEWGVGENLWVPCQGNGNHLLTLRIVGTTVIDTSVGCEGAP